MTEATRDPPKDSRLNREQASALQDGARRGNVLMIWTVYTGTADFGPRYVARPHLVADNTMMFFAAHLVADDLEGVRAQLPPGLTCIGRQPEDDPVIVEVWM